jgi:hypothetical protein
VGGAVDLESEGLGAILAGALHLGGLGGRSVGVGDREVLVDGRVDLDRVVRDHDEVIDVAGMQHPIIIEREVGIGANAVRRA